MTRPIVLRLEEADRLFQEDSLLMVRPARRFLVQDRCRYGTVGEVMWVQEPMPVSTCGHYYAHSLTAACHDVVTNGQRYPWHSQASSLPRGSCYAWGNLGNDRFSVSFGLLTPDAEGGKLRGTWENQRTVEFHQRCAATKLPEWAGRGTVLVNSIETGLLTSLTDEQIEATGIDEWIYCVDGQARSNRMKLWSQYADEMDADDKISRRRAAFALAWNSHHRQYPWSQNPTVWLLSLDLLTSHQSRDPSRPMPGGKAVTGDYPRAMLPITG